MGFSFIHTADIHLGRPFSDLAVEHEKMQTCNRACKKAFNKIVDFAIEKNVDFVLIAGDSFDSDEHDLDTKLIFIRNLEKLADNGIKTYIICGNHDPVSMYKKYPDYFKFDPKYEGIINIIGVTTDKNPITIPYNENVNIHCISFEDEECSNPTKLLPKAGVGKAFNIGLIHCDLDKNDSKYAPCSRDDLKSLGYDYYALGHIHIPEIKEENIVYSGTPQGRTKKETGEHGFYYVDVDDKNNAVTEFVPSDFIRFNYIEIDCTSFNTRKEVFEKIVSDISQRVDDVEMNFYDVNLVGVTNAYDDLNSSDDLFDDYIKSYSDEEPPNAALYRINDNTVPNVDDEELNSDNGIIGLISKSFKNSSDIDEIYDSISEIHRTIYKKLDISTDSKNELLNSLENDRTDIIIRAEKTAKSLCKEIVSLGE